MSPKHVSRFYGADDARTAVEEIRPDPAARVVVGMWRPARPLKLVDLVDLPAEPSFFDWERSAIRSLEGSQLTSALL